MNDHELLRQREWVRRLAARLVADGAIADDLTQDAMALALGQRGATPERGWFAGVIRHIALQRVRAEARRARREREVAGATQGGDVDDALEQVESHRRLLDHVMALDDSYRDVLIKRYFQSMTPAAIARDEGRTVASVCNRLTRAHAALRSRLDADGGKGAWMHSLLPLITAREGSRSLAATQSAVLASAGWASGITAALAVVLLVLWLRPADDPSPSLIPLSADREWTPNSATALATVEPVRALTTERQAGEEIEHASSATAADVPDGASVDQAPASSAETMVHGTLVDERGTPLPGQVVHWFKPAACRPQLRVNYDERKPLVSTVTDASGEFFIPPMQPGCYHVIGTSEGAHLTSYALTDEGTFESTPIEGRVHSPLEVARRATAVEVPAGRQRIDVVVAMSTSGHISGHVVSALTAETVVGVSRVKATRSDGWGQLAFDSEPDGSFRSAAVGPRGSF